MLHGSLDFLKLSARKIVVMSLLYREYYITTFKADRCCIFPLLTLLLILL